MRLFSKKKKKKKINILIVNINFLVLIGIKINRFKKIVLKYDILFKKTKANDYNYIRNKLRTLFLRLLVKWLGKKKKMKRIIAISLF